MYHSGCTKQAQYLFFRFLFFPAFHRHLSHISIPKTRTPVFFVSFFLQPLFVFLLTDGLFTSSSSIYGLDVPHNSRLDFADSEFEKVRIAWYKEFVYLNGTKVYDELDDYIDNDLLGTYQDISGNIPGIDKCSECYRYEPEEGKPASDDFEEAMIKIQQLVGRYV